MQIVGRISCFNEHHGRNPTAKGRSVQKQRRPILDRLEQHLDRRRRMERLIEKGEGFVGSVLCKAVGRLKAKVGSYRSTVLLPFANVLGAKSDRNIMLVEIKVHL